MGLLKKKTVKIVLKNPKNPHINDQSDYFEVKKVTNTLKVKVGELVDEKLVSEWIKDRDNWTIEFVK